MRFIGNVIEKLQRHPKRIVFPEGTEPRVLQAARQYYSLRLGVPILLGDRSAIKDAAARLNVSLEGMRIINPAGLSACGGPKASSPRKPGTPCSR